MKLCRVANIGSGCRSAAYKQNPSLFRESYLSQKSRFDTSHYNHSSAFCASVNELGHEAASFFIDVEPLQQAWAKENLSDSGRHTLADICMEQVKRFKPDVLWFDDHNLSLLRAIRENVPSAKLFIGWEGSALSSGRTWKYLDVLFSCAPETVEYARAVGMRAEHLNHGFDPNISLEIGEANVTAAVTFVGSLIRRNGFHEVREELLLKLLEQCDLRIYSPSFAPPWSEVPKSLACGIARVFATLIRHAGPLSQPLRSTNVGRLLFRIEGKPRLPVNSVLRRHMNPPLYGLDYFRLLRDSMICLNIHADSSPKWASNMRLFEATGVGSCLVTDYRSNMSTLFDLDSEVVTFKTVSECTEKIRWLQDHAQARLDIGTRAAQRVLREHTITHRATQWLAAVQSYM